MFARAQHLFTSAVVTIACMVALALLAAPTPAKAVYVGVWNPAGNPWVLYGQPVAMSWYCADADGTRLWDTIGIRWYGPGYVGVGAGEFGSYTTPPLYAHQGYTLGCQDNQSSGFAHAFMDKQIYVYPPPTAPGISKNYCVGSSCVVAWSGGGNGTNQAFLRLNGTGLTSPSACTNLTGSWYHSGSNQCAWDYASNNGEIGIHNLTPGGYYEFRTYGGSPYYINWTQPGGPVWLQPQPTPTVTSGSCTGTSCTFGWTMPASEAQTNRLLPRIRPVPPGGCSSIPGGWTQTTDSGVTLCYHNDWGVSSSITFNNLAPSTQYTFWLHAANNLSMGGLTYGNASNGYQATTPAPDLCPALTGTQSSYPSGSSPANSCTCPANYTYNSTTNACVAPTMSISSTGAPSEPSTTGTFTVTRGGTSGSVNIPYTVSGTATRGSAAPYDYRLTASASGSITQGTTNGNATAGTITIDSGQPSVTITLTPWDDSVTESAETATVAITVPSGYTLSGSDQASLTIGDNDVPSISTFSSASSNVSYNGATTLYWTTTNMQSTCYLGGGTYGGSSFNSSTGFFTGGSSVSNNSSYPGTSSTGALTTNTSYYLRCTGLDGSTYYASPARTVSVTIPPCPANCPGTYPNCTAQSGYTYDSGNNLCVALPNVTISSSVDSIATEGASPANTGIYTLSRTGATTAALAVSYTRSGTTHSTYGTDYTLGSGTCTSVGASSATIPIGAPSCTVVLTPTVDSNTESGGETAVLTVSANAAYTVGSPSQATVTIYDPTIGISATDPTATEAGPTTGIYTVSRTGSTASGLAVSFTRGGSATYGTDYSLSSATSVTIPAGASSATITLTPINDTVAETYESAIVTLTAPAGYTVSPWSATVSIEDNDVAQSLALIPSASQVNEGDSTNICWSLSSVSQCRLGGGVFGGTNFNNPSPGWFSGGQNLTIINSASSGCSSTGALSVDTSYYLQCTRTNGATEAIAPVTVTVVADACGNIAGHQSTPPANGYASGGECYCNIGYTFDEGAGTCSVADLCPQADMPGAQSTIPTGCVDPATNGGSCIPTNSVWNGSQCVVETTISLVVADPPRVRVGGSTSLEWTGTSLPAAEGCTLSRSGWGSVTVPTGETGGSYSSSNDIMQDITQQTIYTLSCGETWVITVPIIPAFEEF